MKEVSRVGDGIREFVFGANDGTVSTFGILAGLVGANLAGPVIALVGVIQMFAAGLSMGLGAYISTKSQNEYYAEAESEEKRYIDEHPRREKKRVRDILAERGLEGETLKDATKTLTHDRTGWLHFLVEERFGISATSYPHPVFAASVMFLAFLVAGLFPVFPFFVAPPGVALVWSATLSLIILFAVGAAKTRFTKRNWFVSGFENLMIGAITGVTGFVVGSLVQGFL